MGVSVRQADSKTIVISGVPKKKKATVVRALKQKGFNAQSVRGSTTIVVTIFGRITDYDKKLVRDTVRSIVG